MLGYTVSEVARKIGVRPRDISDLFYGRELSDQKCPIIGGKRIIPDDYVQVITCVLTKHGHLVAAKELMSSTIAMDRKQDGGNFMENR